VPRSRHPALHSSPPRLQQVAFSSGKQIGAASPRALNDGPFFPPVGCCSCFFQIQALKASPERQPFFFPDCVHLQVFASFFPSLTGGRSGFWTCYTLPHLARPLAGVFLWETSVNFNVSGKLSRLYLPQTFFVAFFFPFFPPFATSCSTPFSPIPPPF